MIEINNLNYVYPSKKGVFDVTFRVKKGEVFGYLGPNGAGKTTTIRSMMGFVAPVEGSCRINGLDSWKDASEIQRIVGYLPGEMNLLDSMTGIEFLKFMGRMRDMKDFTRMEELIERFQLDTSGKLQSASVVTRFDTGEVAALVGGRTARFAGFNRALDARRG